MILKALCFLLCVPFVVFAQEYPQNYFDSPLKIPLALSGTFGELRGNHFHAGIDIKTQGREGLPIYAPADGQVVRIKVSAYGYGNALYIAHPNGYTTVYGHLQSFSPSVAEWIKNQQYAKKSFEVNLFPPAGKFTFKKGEQIALSGNTGGSGGPHLHFEIRDSKTEETINPAFFGLPISDKRKPIIAHLYAKPISDGATINKYTGEREIALTNLGHGQFKGSFSGSGVIGLVLHTFDQQDLSNNHNGVFTIEQFVNDTVTYAFKIDKFTFDKTRYINAHMDFEKYKAKRQLAHNCFVWPGNFLTNYSHLVNSGFITLDANSQKQIKLIVSDSWGNKSTIQLTATGTDNTVISSDKANQISWKEAHTIKIDGVKIYIPAKSLYKNEEIKIQKSPACSTCETEIYQIGESTIPSHKRYSLGIHKSQLTKTEKLVWANMSGNNVGSGLTTNWEGDYLTANPREFGEFAVVQDLAEPNLEVKNFSNGKIVTAGDKISIYATDKLSGITQYECSIDGQWALLQHDAKRNYFWHDFEDNLTAGSHIITLTFTDEVGNTTTYQAVFTYQP